MIRNLQMKWNEAEMVALVGRRAADWEGKLTYRWVWFNSKRFILFLQNRISSQGYLFVLFLSFGGQLKIRS